jgi:hypothetical protein
MKKLVGSFSDNGMQTVPERVALEEMRGNIVVPGRSAVKRSTNRRAETFGKTLVCLKTISPRFSAVACFAAFT